MTRKINRDPKPASHSSSYSLDSIAYGMIVVIRPFKSQDITHAQLGEKALDGVIQRAKCGLKQSDKCRGNCACSIASKVNVERIASSFQIRYWT